MYSYGSSARAGVGKRGHGGRDYRPPRKRRDPNCTPPPLKECSCLLQFHIAEYAAPVVTTTNATTTTTNINTNNNQQQQFRRDHNTLGGRKGLDEIEKQLRSQYLCHLVVPGRKQSGPIAIVGRTIQEALPAAAYFMSQLVAVKQMQLQQQQPQPQQELQLQQFLLNIPGQIQRNVKDPRDVAIVGNWCLKQQLPKDDEEESNNNNNNNQIQQMTRMNYCNNDTISVQPQWLFQSTQWNVLVCPIRLTLPDQQEEKDGSNNNNNDNSNNKQDITSSTTKPKSNIENNNANLSRRQGEFNHEITESVDGVSGKNDESHPPSVFALKACVDNVIFRLGNTNLSTLQMFVHEYSPITMSLAMGNPQQLSILLEEIQKQIFMS